MTETSSLGIVSIAMAFLILLPGSPIGLAQEAKPRSSDMLRVISDVGGLDIVESSAGGQPIFSYSDIDDLISSLKKRNDQISFLKELFNLRTENRRTNRRRYYAIRRMFGPENLMADSMAVYSVGRLSEKFHLEQDEQTRGLIHHSIRHLVTPRQEIFRRAFNVPTGSDLKGTIDSVLSR